MGHSQSKTQRSFKTIPSLFHTVAKCKWQSKPQDSKKKTQRCQKQTGSSLDHTFHLIWCSLRIKHHYCLQMMLCKMVLRAPSLNIKVLQAGEMQHCCTVTYAADHPSEQDCTLVVKQRDSPTSQSAESLTWTQCFGLRVTETPALLHYKHKQQDEPQRETAHLQARSHRLFTPEHPSHKCLIKSAFFFQIIMYFPHHWHFSTCCKASLDTPCLRHWNSGMKLLQQAEARSTWVQSGNAELAQDSWDLWKVLPEKIHSIELSDSATLKSRWIMISALLT